MSKPSFSVIVACSLDNGIGVGPRIPWRLPHDLEHFHRISQSVRRAVHTPTARNVAIMGRYTYQSMPSSLRPLADRINLILTRDASFAASLPEGVLVAETLDAALALLSKRTDVADIFICGGTRLYDEAVRHTACQRVFLTRVHLEVPESTAHFPAFFTDTPTQYGWQRAPHTALLEYAAQIDLNDHEPQAIYPDGVQQDKKSNITYEFQLFTRKTEVTA